MISTLFISGILALGTVFQPAPEPTFGPLMIVGGGLKDDNKAVYEAFVSEMKGDGPLVIIPAASGAPAESAAHMQTVFKSYGVAPDRIIIAPLAMVDDESTDRVDESKWANNAFDEDVTILLSEASGIWFTGGDQSRITSVLRQDDGTNTPALTAIFGSHQRGSIIGGTSAGAAIMSTTMLTGGQSLPSLLGKPEGRVSTDKGLGFFTRGLIDQHFGERARLGRLAVALAQQPDGKREGYGIDENTALFVSTSHILTVLGEGEVSSLDLNNADITQDDEGRWTIRHMTISVFSSGDKYHLDEMAVRPDLYKKPTIGNEYVDKPLENGGGMALPGMAIGTLLADGLVDNKSATSIERLSFDDQGNGVTFLFQQTQNSQGFWGRDDQGQERRTILNIDFSIYPFTYEIHKTEKMNEENAQ